MALEDRDYMHGARGGRVAALGAVASWSVTTRLVVANVLVFVLWQVDPLAPLLRDHFTVSLAGVLDHGRVWTLVTHAFSHLGLWHLVWNMLFLWWFGRDLETVYGGRSLLALYLGAAVVGGAVQLAANVPGGPLARATPCLGASGAVSATLAAAAILFPTRTILLWFVIPVPLWLLAVIYIASDLLGLRAALTGVQTGVGHGAHLGGAAFGAAFHLLDLRPWGADGRPRWRWVARAGAALAWRPWRRRPRLRVLPPLDDRLPPAGAGTAPSAPPAPPSGRVPADVAARVDDLLRKIAAEGMASLTAEERAFLERASGAYRGP